MTEQRQIQQHHKHTGEAKQVGPMRDEDWLQPAPYHTWQRTSVDPGASDFMAIRTLWHGW
jgi:hypothetical protein